MIDASSLRARFPGGRRCLLLALTFIFASGEMAEMAHGSDGVHTTYLWHMHQPIYWPDESTWNPGRYETAYETIVLGNSQNDVFSIFDMDDRVAAYQQAPRDAVGSISDLAEAGAQVSFAGALIENLFSLADAGWNGGRYASDWYQPYRTARSWSNGAGKPRLEPVLVGFHHAIAPLMDDVAFRMELACAKEIYGDAWGDSNFSQGFFPAEMCFSERLIPALVDAGVEWSIVGDTHISRACADYPYAANEDNCDPPNRADQINPAQGTYTQHTISRGVTVKTPYPYGFTPHRAEYVDPETGAASQLVVVPASNAMGWDEGYGLYGTGDIDGIAAANDPERPMLVLFAHDGDNAWSGGHSYYYENVSQFSHAADAAGYTPTTVATYLQDHPVPLTDVVHVEDGGWVNADGDFGSPQFINWNWPLVAQDGSFDIPGGWAEDERNWAVLTAAQNRVETAAANVVEVRPTHVVDPLLSGTNDAERAWHFLLAGYESGYMYYGASIDMEVKATLACNHATALADPLLVGGVDTVGPTIWLPQRLPWNPGGFGGGSLWGYPGGQGAPMDSTFHVWTFVHDVSSLARVELKLRSDLDGWNDPSNSDNETYAGGSGVGGWTTLPMNFRSFPVGEPWDLPEIDFFELPDFIADQYWIEVTGFSDVLLDYYVEAEDMNGNVKRSPIQHVYVGTGSSGGGPGDGVTWQPHADETLWDNNDGQDWSVPVSGGSEPPFVLDGSLDAGVPLLAETGELALWGEVRDGFLYVAASAAGEATNLDRFLHVALSPDAAVAAPWAKDGDVSEWEAFLAREESNGWSGWFDSNSQVVTDGGGYGHANGSVLEGTLSLDTLDPDGMLSEVWVAVAAYGTDDGGILEAQAPAGNGDGDLLGSAEYVTIPLVSAETDAPDSAFDDTDVVRDALQDAEVGPNPVYDRVEIRFRATPAGPVRLDLFDVAGRRKASRAFETVEADRILWAPELKLTSGGVFFLRLQSGSQSTVRKLWFQ